MILNTKILKPIKLFAPALALFAALLYAGCVISDSDDSYIRYDQHPASAMTQTQYAAATSAPITVENTTKTLVLSGVSGKTIYMARTNPLTKTIASNNTRIATVSSGISSSVAESKSAAEGLDDIGGFAEQAFGLPDFETAKDTDPHARIYQLYLDGLKSAKKTGVSKSMAPGVMASPKSYAVGDTETFWALHIDKNLNYFDKDVEFKLIVSESAYNIWVRTDDQYYKADTSVFETAAQKLGKKFINGYGLVSHIYGNVSDYIYTADSNDNVTKYAPMSTYSKTGDKINIMLYDMLTVGNLYGFIFQGDFIKGYSGSNEGRFVYLDSQTLIKQPLEAYSTSLHEFSHAISFTQKTLNNGVQWTYWFGELMAMMCEDMMQAYLGISDSDVNGDLASTPKARLPSANYNDTWGTGLTGQDVGTYSATFMLGSWLVRKFGGVKFIRELTRNNKVDMQSILAAIAAVTQKSYTATSLLQEYENDKFVHISGAGFDQDADTYPGNDRFTHNYTDDLGTTQPYLYPLTAINLWEPFYGWCDISGYSDINGKNYISNTSIPFSDLPKTNIYAKADWAKKGRAKPTTAYLGPLLLTDAQLFGNIGPYGSMPFKLGTATNNTVTINFKCYGGLAFSDIVTIYVKD